MRSLTRTDRPHPDLKGSPLFQGCLSLTIIDKLPRIKVVRYRRAEMLPCSCKIRVGKIRGLGWAWWHIGSSIPHDKFEFEILR
jgi:hypothetical protein